MVLKLNEYVRTKDGIIAKVIGVQSGGIEKYFFDKEVHNLFNYLNGLVVENVVVKHSFNIEDLVQKGDFVNGYEVDDFDGYDEEGNYFENDLGIPIYDDANMDCIVEYRPIRLMDIKSIVTKEQFKAMEYEVK